MEKKINGLTLKVVDDQSLRNENLVKTSKEFGLVREKSDFALVLTSWVWEDLLGSEHGIPVNYMCVVWHSYGITGVDEDFIDIGQVKREIDKYKSSHPDGTVLISKSFEKHFDVLGSY